MRLAGCLFLAAVLQPEGALCTCSVLLVFQTFLRVPVGINPDWSVRVVLVLHNGDENAPSVFFSFSYRRHMKQKFRVRSHGTICRWRGEVVDFSLLQAACWLQYLCYCMSARAARVTQMSTCYAIARGCLTSPPHHKIPGLWHHPCSTCPVWWMICEAAQR